MKSDLPADVFARAVLLMRLRQREYFKKPIVPKIIAAKAAEKIVDQYLDQMGGVRELFPTDPNDVESETHA